MGILSKGLSEVGSIVRDAKNSALESAADLGKGAPQHSSDFSPIEQEQAKIESAYNSLGKLYYELHGNNPEPQMQGLVEEIASSLSAIEDYYAGNRATGQFAVCPSCGNAIADSAAFCSHCGQPLNASADAENVPVAPETCLYCGFENTSDTDVCPKCGGPLVISFSKRLSELQQTETCPYCAADNPVGSQMCSSCGMRLR